MARQASAPGACPVATGAVPGVVVDTNRVLDLWLFDDPATRALRHAIKTGALRWLAVPAMRDELARVLAYPLLARQLVRRGRTADEVLGAFDRWAHPVVAPAPAALACSDPDDQVFVDLAVAWRATLVSRDREVLVLADRLRAWGVSVVVRDVMP